MAEKHTDEKFLKFIIEHIVEHPDDVKIERKVDEMGVLLSLHVNSDDMGQVIGRKGSTARALRTLLRIVGLKEDARVNLKIEEPEGSSKPESSKKKSSSSESDEDELKL
ncbi:MAG TPA: KH domain-containing protein [Patescibacteria group bacterium]|nr:KH domain-containing protein [Patescibacteria group bacterium]